MAVTGTTLSSAVSVDATQIKVAATTGFGKGKFIYIDGECMQQSTDLDGSSLIVNVLRAQEGTVQAAHPASAKVIVGAAFDDFPNAGDASASTSPFPQQPNRPVYSYSATGALSPVEGLHILNGTGALAMTLASPTKLQDGQVMTILGNGKAAHTVTYTPGFGDASTGYTVATYPTGGQACMQLVAANGIWVPLNSPFAGTVTAIDISIA